MRTITRGRATILLAASALAFGCTGGQSGTETPAPMAGKGGSGGSPVVTITSGGDGGRDGAGSGPDEGGTGGMMGRMESGSGGSGRAGSGGRSGLAPSGTGGKRGIDGFAPQTGDENNVCACALAGKGALLRARLFTLDDCALRAEVEEVLALPADFSETISVGDEIDARRWIGCGDVPELDAGDTALIVYVPPASGTMGDALVASWSDPLVFGQVALGQPIALPRDEQEKLLEPAACPTGFATAAKGTASGACKE